MSNPSMINDYAANPVNNFKMENPTVTYAEGNSICDDSIEIFMAIKDGKIEKFSYIGELSIVGLAAASIVAEEIEGKNIEDVLTWDFEYIKNLGFEVSPKRRRAAVMPILAARNAIHDYKKDGQKDDFDDLVDC